VLEHFLVALVCVENANSKMHLPIALLAHLEAMLREAQPSCKLSISFVSFATRDAALILISN
jgi:hypothetical protein